MTIEDLKYVTPLDIQNAHINVTSAEMYAEAKEVNTHMYAMQSRRVKFLRDFWSLLGMNVAILVLAVLTGLDSHFSLIFKLTGGVCSVGGNVYLTLLPLLFYTVGYAYFILIRKVYNSWIMLIFAAMLVPMNYICIILVIADTVIVHFMGKIDDEIKNEVGYPHFAELHISTLREGKGAEEGDMDKFEDGDKSLDLEGAEQEKPPADPYAKYRIKPEDDLGLLRDNDIDKDKHTSDE